MMLIKFQIILFTLSKQVKIYKFFLKYKKTNMAWINLFIAGLFEVAWAIGLKYSHGFTKLYPSIFTITAYIFSIVFLSFAVKSLPIGTAYAVWTGIGAVGTVILGIMLLGESSDLPRIICILLILTGIVGLKLFTPNSE